MTSCLKLVIGRWIQAHIKPKTQTDEAALREHLPPMPCFKTVFFGLAGDQEFFRERRGPFPGETGNASSLMARLGVPLFMLEI